MGADAAEEEQFGPYAVYERLGVGGMATVHRALEHTGAAPDRLVALKRLLPHLAEDASFIKAFVREAKLASLLDHPNIVRIYELGRVGTEYFITMEYIDGRDVRRVLRHARKVTGPAPIHVTVGLMLQLCDALDYAHNRLDEEGQPLGLVHRDVSPSNLIVTAEGVLKVIDFGIAKAQSSQLRTQTGRVKGKLAYMAPEAISSAKDLDARSDLWAVGVILHELLTARPLFASKNEYQTLLKVQRGDIMPPSTFNQACPPELDAIVFKALARDPDHRFAQAAHMREELDEVRRKYQLQTSQLDVAAWIDWAFSLEQPGTFSATASSTGVSPLSIPQVQTAVPAPLPTSRPKPRRAARNRDEDEAVEIAWGGGEAEQPSGPIVLDEVPDVSAKRPRRDHRDDPAEDGPTPGGRSQRGTRAPTVVGHNRGLAIEDELGALPPAELDPALAAGTDPPIAHGGDRLVAQRVTGQHARQPMPRLTQPDLATATPVKLEDLLDATDRAPKLVPGEADVTMPHMAASDTGATHVEIPIATKPGVPSADLHFEPVITPLPVVRFTKSQSIPPLTELAASTTATTAPLPVVAPAATPGGTRPPQTKPGLGAPVRPRTATLAPATSAALEADAIPTPRAPTADITVGASMVERRKGGRAWLWVLAVIVIGGGGAAAYLIAQDRAPTARAPGESSATPAPARTTGTVKFLTDPLDAEIKVEGQPPHTGTPWAIELPAGIHQIEVHRGGYKTWLSSIELSAGETQIVHAGLVPITAAEKQKGGEASLAITTTPPGLEVVLDGRSLTQPTPLKMSIKVGAHTIVVRQNGAEVWRQKLAAEANSDYEYNPTITRPRAAAPEPPAQPAQPAPAAAPPDAAAEHVAPDAAPAPEVKPPVTIDPPAPIPAPRAAHAGPPPIVPPTAVTRLSGDPPTIAQLRNTSLPSLISAKLCIDTTGAVTSVDIPKIERHAQADLIEALKAWRYAPYQRDGAPSPACFSVTFRIK
ncbi:MAG TPA: serine/threonine-protein kinase [Kofleriaceae bacterium]|nr:serine/threonine-protein kinase [Kofleriaceae bacterium]